jgi:outer membrane protein TolC
MGKDLERFFAMLGGRGVCGRNSRIAGLCISVALLLGSGCSRQHYQKSADREAYRTIAEKAPRVPNMEPQFTIEQTNVLSLEGLPVVTQPDEVLGSEANSEVGAKMLSLEQALAIAVKHSRVYQNNKEQLYLQALSLTLARHRYTPIFAASAKGDYQVTTSEVQGAVDQMVEARQFSANGSVGVEWLLRTGARLSTALTTDFLRFLTGDPRSVTSSQLSGELVQPLLRGAGYKVAMENLTQAERSLLYQLREFVLFRKEFSVQVATAYYGVLRDRDEVRNSYLGLLAFRKNAERTRALVKEGRTKQGELGRIEQQELDTEGGWISAIRRYQQDLDQFKILLGLSTDAKAVLDDRDLAQLKIDHPQMKVEDAIQVALATRLDLATVHDQLVDAQRQVSLAANGLKPQLDMVASGGISSGEVSGNKLPVPDVDRYRWSAGLNLDLGLDRKAERNDYRSALIAQERARRQLEVSQDEIKLRVRNGWRTLDEAKRTYERSVLGVKLSERRVEEQELLSELGRGQALDLIDAQNALIASKNQLTQALVGHTIARLQFWNNLGILFIMDNGQWAETNAEKIQQNK